MRAPVPLLVLGALLSLPCARPARAMGYCEDLQMKYILASAALPAGLLAFDVEIEYCDDINTAKTSAVLVTDLTLGARRWFASPKEGSEADGVKAALGKVPIEPTAAWTALEKAQGFRKLAEVALPKECPVEAVALEGKTPVPLAKAEAKNNFVNHRLGVQVRVVENVPPRPVELGPHPHGAAAPGLWVVMLPRGPRAYVSSARCLGGPPPGYGGSDHPGICYTKWRLSYKDLPPIDVTRCGALASH